MLFGVSDYHILSSAHQYAAYTATIGQMRVCNVTAVACHGRSIDGYHPTLVIISCEPLIVFQLCLDFSSHNFSLAVQSRVSEFFFLVSTAQSQDSNVLYHTYITHLRPDLSSARWRGTAVELQAGRLPSRWSQFQIAFHFNEGHI